MSTIPLVISNVGVAAFFRDNPLWLLLSGDDTCGEVSWKSASPPTDVFWVWISGSEMQCRNEMPVKTHIVCIWGIVLGCKHLNSMGILQGSRNRAAIRKEKLNSRYGRRVSHSNYKKQACKSLQNNQEPLQHLSYFHSMRKEKHVYKLWLLPAGDDPWVNHLNTNSCRENEHLFTSYRRISHDLMNISSVIN